MPTAKGKGGSASHRYRPASEYDDNTLAQKREYWRTKKREQRARLSERRGKPTKDSRGEKLLHLTAPAAVNSRVSGSFATASLPMQSNHETYKTVKVSPASKSGNTAGDSSLEASESQKEKWFQTMKLNKVSPPFPASCSISAKAAGGNKATVKCRTAGGAVNRAVTSPTPSGTQLNTSPSVPPVRVTRITNGSSAKTAPQPCVSMQGTSVPKMQQKAQVALRIQPKLLPTNVTTGGVLVSSPCGPVSIKTEGKTANTTPQRGTKSALVTAQRAKGVGSSQPSMESEEERAAKRREHWRIKKREQRAKLAARIAKARERTQGAETMVQRQTAQKPALVGGTVLQHLHSQSFLKGAGQRQCPARLKTSVTSAKRENNKLQSGAAGLASVNLQVNQIKVQNPHENSMTQTETASKIIPVKKTGESQRKLPSYVHLSNFTRGIARCKTPRQRFIEAQKNFMNQRSIRCKSPLLTSVFGTRNIPRIDPNDTPEQIIAKRREYWRIKKREQRAKLSMEVKARLKEKDSLMRRVKRYQRILEEMRRARALAQAAGSTLTHASETIGGFIKEDGTVTINIPQGPTGPNTAAHKSEDELHVGSSNTSIIQPQHQPNTKRSGITPIRINQPPTALRSAQVKVSFPLSGQLVNKSARLLSVRPRTHLESTTAPNSHSTSPVGQLTLTHPQTRQNAVSGGSAAGSNLGSCVMKMAVSSSAPSLSALSLDPELTEEERMAKKREYWRIKKREQRAARAARLKQGFMQARANAALQRRRAQRQVAVTTVPPSRILTNHTGSAPPLPSDSVPVTPNANEIKQEIESVPAVDLNSQPEQAVCPDIKPPTSPPPTPAPQPESDPALSADSQATTLLAVASMKKLLEESLSTVRECKSEQPCVKMETTEESSEQEIKPNLPQLFFEKDEVVPIAADLTLQIKSWQPDDDVSAHEGSPSPDLKDSSQTSETLSPLPTSSEVVLHPTCEHSSQTPSNVIVSPSIEASDSPSSPRRTQRLRTKKVGHQNCCSPEPPKLHHLPIDQLQPQQQHVEPQVQEQCHNRNLPSAQRYRSVGTEQSGWTSLQRKREYWKLMKRQQRARLKARQRARQGECSSHLSPTNIQAPGLVIINTVKGVNPQTKPALQPKPSIASLAAVTSIPTVLVVSPATCNAEQSPDTLQVNLPITSVSCSPRSEQNMNAVPSQIMSDCLGAPENQHQAVPVSQKWMFSSTDVDSSACLPTLRPPDNPLSSINLQPIEPPGQTPNSSLSPMKIPSSQLHSPTHVIQSQPPAKLAPVSTLVPPKPIPGESEEDFLRRKREYWRIKKKEQRARKAIRDKGIPPRRAANNWRPILPAHDLPTQVQAAQDSGQWVSSSDESEHLMSTSVDTDQASFPYSSYTVPLEESELLFSDYENNSGEEGSVSDAVWRNCYLMDYDPLNQLLVCMVCGELQYSHTLEGVSAHIDEAHPDTLTLEPGERQRILEAWDEQVSQRERFFTSQLQQHSGSLAEAHRN
ncbi:uncharacterized protein si:dkey-28a3.2 isoform X2 [Seriola aureovittata]|uniref:uncharacterized protein si:dkey-28a3.2 isoform X2 n=1 Tax=Seriola aureovittata TaxID=2871759 RepID=UPI0024BE3FA1|nr:uncharacterized protein si:dkey-28a3.2 isoform X2 [Seriola aureovittata]